MTGGEQEVPLVVVILVAVIPAALTGASAIVVAILQGRKTDKKVDQVSGHVGISNGHGTLADMMTKTLIEVGEIKEKVAGCPFINEHETKVDL